MKKIMCLERMIFYCLLIGFISCEKDKSHIDKPEPCTDVKYRLYVGNQGADQVYVIDLDSNTVIDTLSGFTGEIINLAITKSGRKMFVRTVSGYGAEYSAKAFSVDMSTKEKKIIHDRPSEIVVAPDGSVFLFSYIIFEEDSSLAVVGTIDTITDNISFFDTLNIRNNSGLPNHSIIFDRHRPVFYSVTDSNQLFAYDYNQRKILRRYNLYGSLLSLSLSLDGKKLYAAGGPVFDLENDSIIGIVGGNHLGSVALKPTGDYLYVTDPGGYIIPPSPTGKVYIFETSSNSYVGEIDIRPFAPESKITDYIVISPDGKTAYISNWLKYIFVIDIETNTVLHVMSLNSFTNILAIAPVCNDSN